MVLTRRVHIVRRGETLSLIGRHYRVSVRALARANAIRNVNLIYVGQRLTIPSTARPAPASGRRAASEPPGRETTGVSGGRLTLTAIDIVNIKKTLQTEWVQSVGNDQAYGIIDTILNRTASRHWGRTVADVVNARNQFSAINGPAPRREGRTSVDQFPASNISRRVDQLTDSYLAERADGRRSIIGSHLNYANPHYSDAKNLVWINRLDGPRLGRGRAIHHHGTVPELQGQRPAPYQITLPGIPAERPALRGRQIDGNAVAAANGVEVKPGGNVRIGQLDATMGPVIVAVAQIADQHNLPRPVITSGNDSGHKRNSLHYANQALDFRGRNISIAQGRALAAAVSSRLGNDYDVIFETFANSNNNHLHVEYDPD